MEKNAVKTGIVANNLSRLMLNKKGPTEKKRRLYQNVTSSILLYRAPIWTEEVNLFPKIVNKIWSIQRKVALRVIKAYRTVSLVQWR